MPGRAHATIKDTLWLRGERISYACEILDLRGPLEEGLPKASIWGINILGQRIDV